MDDSYPKICRSDNPPVRLKLGEYHSRPMSETEIRRLRDALNADAADTGPTGVHVDGRTFMIDHIRYATDRFDELHWCDWDEMDADDIDAAWASVHSMISTCLVAVGEETVARVTTDELRSVALDLTHARDADEKSPPELLSVLTRVSNELTEMSERAGGGAATLWQVDHVDGDWPWIVEHESLDDPEFIGPQPDDVTDEQLVEVVRNMLGADPCTFVIRRREETEPPTWTAEPPECDCWWRCQLTSGTAETRSLQWNGVGYISTTSYWSRDSLLQMSVRNPLDRFLAILGGIPVCPEVTP